MGQQLVCGLQLSGETQSYRGLVWSYVEGKPHIMAQVGKEEIYEPLGRYLPKARARVALADEKFLRMESTLPPAQEAVRRQLARIEMRRKGIEVPHAFVLEPCPTPADPQRVLALGYPADAFDPTQASCSLHGIDAKLDSVTLWPYALRAVVRADIVLPDVPFGILVLGERHIRFCTFEGDVLGVTRVMDARLPDVVPPVKDRHGAFVCPVVEDEYMPADRIGRWLFVALVAYSQTLIGRELETIYVMGPKAETGRIVQLQAASRPLLELVDLGVRFSGEVKLAENDPVSAGLAWLDLQEATSRIFPPVILERDRHRRQLKVGAAVFLAGLVLTLLHVGFAYWQHRDARFDKQKEEQRATEVMAKSRAIQERLEAAREKCVSTRIARSRLPVEVAWYALAAAVPDGVTIEKFELVWSSEASLYLGTGSATLRGRDNLAVLRLQQDFRERMAAFFLSPVVDLKATRDVSDAGRVGEAAVGAVLSPDKLGEDDRGPSARQGEVTFEFQVPIGDPS